MNHKHEGEADRINMIAGGTGITPMYQVMKEILSNPADKTCLRLLYANQTEEDILIRKELEGLQAQHPDRFASVPSVSCDRLSNGQPLFVSKQLISSRRTSCCFPSILPALHGRLEFAGL
jgi:NAD(P)H-flavin reductase